MSMNWAAGEGTLPPPPLSQQVAHVWVHQVPPLQDLLPQMGILSPEEQRRAERLQLTGDQRRFLAGRLFLRRLLSGYSGLPAAAIAIEHSPRGKPYWRDPPQPLQGLQFNLSHSHERVLIALVLQHSIGVDLEWIRPVPRWQAIARRYFSPAEQAQLANCSEQERDPLFFRIWTQKEALLKATGSGLAGSALWSRDAGFFEQRQGQTWTVHSLEIEAGYAAAVAVERVASHPLHVILHWAEKG